MSMDIKFFSNTFLKRIWFIIIFSLTASCTSAYMNYFILQPVYQANTTLFVINNSTDANAQFSYDDILIGQQLVGDYTEIIKSRTVMRKVLEDLKPENLSEEDVEKKISVNSKNETRVFEIVAQANDPVIAMKIANSVAKVFSVEVVKLLKVKNVSIIDEAQQPVEPVGPKRMINIALTFIVSLVIVLSFVFLVEYMDNTIKTTEDVEEFLHLKAIGIIPMHSLK